MTTQISELNAESHDVLHRQCLAIYLDGECYAFATALHEGLGWPMIGLMDGDVIRHVAATDPNGVLHDVRGPISEKEFGEPFDFRPPYDLQEVSVGKLVRAGKTKEKRVGSVKFARRWAEKLWPTLPWLDSEAMRITNFGDELEALSRKHGLWIRAPYPASKPVLATGEGDEAGYGVYLSDDGISYAIDRRLK
jgi:hypothetical protein